MVSREIVKHIAKLARLSLTPQEEERFQKDFSEILDYVEVLKKVDVSEVKPATHAIGFSNVMRKDEVKFQGKELREKLINAAPQKEKGYIKVKSVF